MKKSEQRRTRDIETAESQLAAMPAFIRGLAPWWCPAEEAVKVIDEAVDKLWKKYPERPVKEA